MSLCILFTALWASPALAGTVDLQPGVEYAAGTRVRSPQHRVSFLIPPRWKGGLPPGAEAMLLGSDTDAGMVLVSAEVGGSTAEVKAALTEAVPLDMLTVLQPTGQPGSAGPVVTQRYLGGDLVGYARARVLRASTIVFVVVGPQTDDARLRTLADALMGSVREEKAQTPSAPTGGMANALKGKKVYYLKVANGFSDEWSTFLCSDGTAIWSSNSSGMSTGGGATLTYAGQDSSRGTWSVQGNQLVVRWQDGSSNQLPVRMQGGSVRIDASNHWVQPQQVCP